MPVSRDRGGEVDVVATAPSPPRCAGRLLVPWGPRGPLRQRTRIVRRAVLHRRKVDRNLLHRARDMPRRLWQTAKPSRPSAESPAHRAFEELFSEHLDAVYRAALRLCRGREPDAQDLVQETALRAFRAVQQLRDPSAARPWLFTILGRTYLNQALTAKRRSETLFTDLDVPELERALEQWQPSRTPEEVLARRELRARLIEAFGPAAGPASPGGLDGRRRRVPAAGSS